MGRMGCTTFCFFCPSIPAMAITPLYTLAELDTEILQAKKDLAAARRSLSSQFETAGGTNRRLQRDSVTALQNHLFTLTGLLAPGEPTG